MSFYVVLKAEELQMYSTYRRSVFELELFKRASSLEATDAMFLYFERSENKKIVFYCYEGE